MYEQGRSLNTETLRRWHDAVMPLLPDRRPLRVLDLGSGTGIFTRAWPTWCPTFVVAVEPSVAMWGRALHLGLPALMSGGVRAIGEHLPIQDQTIDVAWLSTVVHHLTDLPSCAVELARVLGPDGRLLIRGLLADRGGGPGWLRFFADADRAFRSYPTAADLIDQFAERGLAPIALHDVEEPSSATAAQAATWVRTMRRADTLLAAFSDADIDEACRAMETTDPSRLMGPTRLSLLALG